MFRLVYGSTLGLLDLESFLDRIGDPTQTGELCFEHPQDLYVTRAPGRLDLMGGIADYSGSLVLQMPIADAALVALQKESSPVLTLASLSTELGAPARRFSMPLSDLVSESGTISYSEVRDFFSRDPSMQWAAYVAGCFVVLARELDVRFDRGARILIESKVPEGKGVSSSAALEVASMQAIAAAFDIKITPLEVALLCQRVENLLVGAPCGVMDQMTAVFGEPNTLLRLLCQPAQLEGSIDLPPEIAVWGLDSGVRHFVSGADYTTVRVAAFMGYRMMAEIAGLAVRQHHGSIEIDDALWNGYLANVKPAEFERDFIEELPDLMKGSDYLARYHGITDSVTRVDPNQTYPVRAATTHPILEHFRVRSFAELITDAENERRLDVLGELMYQSHSSYSACGLGSDGTDLLVNLVREAGPKRGLYGAKITGGGSGGTVAILGHAGAGNSVSQVADEYRRITGREPRIFSGSSPGSAVFGHLLLRPR